MKSATMKRARMKETIGNNGQCLTMSRQDIPVDLIVEILLKIPVRSISRLVLVSKQLSSIIRGKEFTKMYLAQTSTRIRVLFIVLCLYVDSQFLQSSSQEDPSSSDDHHRVNITKPRSHVYAFSPPVRGLICRQNDTQVMIGNPTTGQFLTLPRVRTKRRGIFSFLGYDPVNDVYKVLCMTVLYVCQRRGSRVVSEEHQVFTLGAKQKWRMIGCKHPHLLSPYTKGICINGVVYYYAWIKNEGSLISFDLISEDFNVIKLPQDSENLVNYTGKIALTSQFYGKLDVWVLEDASKQEWSKVSVSVPSWTDLVGKEPFKFRGTLSTGELIFSPLRHTNPFYLISYDLKENNAKKVFVQGIGDHIASFEVYFDHVESPMFLSN